LIEISAPIAGDEVSEPFEAIDCLSLAGTGVAPQHLQLGRDCVAYGLQMKILRALPLVALSVMAFASLAQCEQQQPETAPTRDVDITYQITRRGQPAVVERRRWSASQQLRRVDGPDKSATIFDQRRGELTLLNAANHTYLTLVGPAAKRMSPEKGTVLKRGSESQIAGLTCIDWSWMVDTEMHTACLTEDGVLLRLVIDDLIVASALTVLYAPQSPDLFEVPPGYEPALAPQGGPGE
jgi:hypothetical protein